MPGVAAPPHLADDALRAFELPRVLALVGPYGAGKTEIALHLAGIHAARGRRAAIADLDVLKPYFRSREAAARSRAVGVATIAPPGALAHADLPIVPAALRGAIADPTLAVVLDVGGDAAGARVVGSLSDVLGAAGAAQWLVVNRHRPFMDSVDGALTQAAAVAAASGLPWAGVVANTHLMDDTTMADVAWGLEFARAIAVALAVPVRALGVPAALGGQAAQEFGAECPPIVAIARAMVPEFAGGVACAAGGGA